MFVICGFFPCRRDIDQFGHHKVSGFKSPLREIGDFEVYLLDDDKISAVAEFSLRVFDEFFIEFLVTF